MNEAIRGAGAKSRPGEGACGQMGGMMGNRSARPWNKDPMPDRGDLGVMDGLSRARGLKSLGGADSVQLPQSLLQSIYIRPAPIFFVATVAE